MIEKKSVEVTGMNFLEARICKEGVVKPGNVLKVDSFLNHQIDMALMDEIGAEFHRRFADVPITKVLTIESSGIAIACAVARCFSVPVVVAKKTRSINIDGDVYTAQIESESHKDSKVVVAKKFITPADRVLIVDDFLAGGYTLQALISIVESADASIEGLGIAIEKCFQEGGRRMRNLGYRLESLAMVTAMDPTTGEVQFAE